MRELPSLFDPLKVGSLKLKNRIVLPPMATNYATEKGEVTDKLVKHYADRAEDLGLLIVEHSNVSSLGKFSLNQLGVYSDTLVPGLTKLVNAVHEKGAPIALQINHAGSSTSREVCGDQPVAPSPILHPRRGQEIPRELSPEEIEKVIMDFRDAARRAKEAGFDAVEIHGAHGFLLGQFLSSITNKRQDKYGGDLENRVRLSSRIVEEVRKELGPEFPLLYRIGVTDMLPGGITLDEGVEAAKIVAGKGIDVLDVSGGFVGSRPEGFDKPGYYVPYAAVVKKAVKIPVIGVGGITKAIEADKIIRSGQVDLVAVGRAILRDPEWAKKAVTELNI